MTEPNDPNANYPSAPPIQPPPEAPVGPAPMPVTRAVQLMFVGAALSVIGLIVTLASTDAIRDQVREDNPNAADVDAIVNTTIAFSVIVGVISTALWIWLALMVRKGKNWARIVTWVLAGIGVLFTVLGLLNPVNGLNLTLTIIGGLLDLAIIVLLATRQSNEFFKPRTPA